MNMIIDLDEDDTVDVQDEYADNPNRNATAGIHPRKRQKADEYHPGSDSSDFPNSTATPSMIGRWKPPAIAKATVTYLDRKSGMKRNVSDPDLPLNLDSRGQAKGAYALGSRVRMGKST